MTVKLIHSYAELHCHTNYSFQEGASWTHELVERAVELGYRALAITDHDNLCGALEFAKTASKAGLQGITGAELTLAGGGHVTLLAETRAGYANLSNLISLAHGCDGTPEWRDDRRKAPELDPALFAENALSQQPTRGLILLTGCRKSPLSTLVDEGRLGEAQQLLSGYVDCFGADNVFVEMQQNLVHGDTARNRRLAALAQDAGVGAVATNNVHYHARDRHRLNDALVAIKSNSTLDQTHRERRPNSQFYMKSPAEMARLFRWHPEAIANTVRIAERCTFDLRADLGYTFPDHPVPKGHTVQSWLAHICREAALRRYGSLDFRYKVKGASPQTVAERMSEELKLISRHGLAGFFLIYYDLVRMARDVMIELGLSEPEIPLEERAPGRGRGSSVAMLVGYLMGISHIDPLKFGLSLSRFMPDEAMDGVIPDIDLDFPRNIREELIVRMQREWGPKRAVLTGMISTYKPRGVIRDLGSAFGVPSEDLDRLTKQIDWRHFDSLAEQMAELPAFRDRTASPVWREIADLAGQLINFPKYLAQHPGGMVLDSRSLMDIVPVVPSAMEGRFVCQWDKDSADDARFVKIDFLALGALSQMQDALALIEERTGEYVDLSRVDFEDETVYADIHRADTVGVFQIESAAQMQTITRIRPRNLTEMAYEVAAVRPGVGVNDGVGMFVRRHVAERAAEKALAEGRRPTKRLWGYDHPLEAKALERTLGIILFQDQVNQLAMDVAGMSPVEADRLRRAFRRTFTSRGTQEQIAGFRQTFVLGAAERGVPRDTALVIFEKFNGQYMFPEAHAFAFGITAYHMSWLKHYYPLEFYVGLYNQQPMGFYSIESLKEDARRHGVAVLNPDANLSTDVSVIHRERLLVGLRNVKNVGSAEADKVLAARVAGGQFRDIGDFMRRTGLRREPLEGLAYAGAFDALHRDRREVLWEIGLRYRPVGSQQALALPVSQDMAPLAPLDDREEMVGEYAVMDLYPRGHLMELVRELLPPGVVRSDELRFVGDGVSVLAAGRVIRRQHPSGKAIFLTLEDEYGHIPVMMFPDTYKRLRHAIREPVLLVRGKVSRREGTMNIMLTHAEAVRVPVGPLPATHDWR
jgi:error-prone DNA polymerase